MKKLKILLIAFSFIFYMQAQANTTQLVGAGTMATGSVLTYLAVATGGLLLGASGIGIGIIGATLVFSNLDTPSASASSAPLTINLNPNVPLITPTGWTPPVAPATQATPPSTVAKSTVFYANNQNNTASYASDMDSACKIWETTTGLPNYACKPGTCALFSGVSYGTCKNVRLTGASAGLEGEVAINQAAICNAGYTASGSNCNLTNATQVIKPESNHDTIARSGNTFVRDAQQNPKDNLPTTALTIASNVATLNSANGAKTTITINTDGTTTVVENKPNTTDSNTTSKTTTFSAPSSSGDVTVTGVTSQQLTGQGSLVGAPTTGSAQPLDVSALNKEATQGQIKSNTDTMKADIGTIKNAITNSANNPTDLATQKTDYDTIAQAHSDKIKSIGDGALDEHGVDKSFAKPMIDSAVCSSLSMPVNGHTSTIDFCNKTNAAKDILGWIFYALTAWGIFGIFTTKRE